MPGNGSGFMVQGAPLDHFAGNGLLLQALLLATIAAPSVAGAAERQRPTVDQVSAFFQKGIVPKHATSAKSKAKTARPRHNRVYTVAEIEAKFGKPRARQNFKTLGSLGSAPGSDGGICEAWLYRCSDGLVAVRFREVGNVADGGAKSLRLEILGFESKRGAPPAGMKFEIGADGRIRARRAPKSERAAAQERRDAPEAQAGAGPQ
jgi:hypothetical protein